MIQQNLLSYTCNEEGNAVSWTSSFFAGAINIFAGGSMPSIPQLTVSGVDLMVNATSNSSCVRSVLTLNGSPMSLEAVDGETLTCNDPPNGVLKSTTIVVPSK